MTRAFRIAAFALAAVGVLQVAAATWIHAKALVAQHLIASAWSQAGGAPAARPWPWADMRPVARLTVPSHRVDLYVLDDASRRSLAFGPALVSGTAPPASAGNTVIVAHRDTHFRFLKDLVVDEEIDLDAGRGARARYRVRDVEVVDRDDTEVMDAAGGARLTLITCFPFDALRPGTRLRYVVTAERVG
jgi:sortase A